MAKKLSKMMITMIDKHGSEEAARDWFRGIGSEGGKAKVPKGFAINPERARLAGKKGGTISRRGKAAVR